MYTKFKQSLVVILLLSIGLITPINTLAYIDGQIRVDPQHPQWFMYHNGGPHFLCAAGGMEDFMYRNDQATLITKVNNSDMNGIYMKLTVKGANSIVLNPWVSSNPANGLREDWLHYWDQMFDSMDNKGVAYYIVIYDKDADPFAASGATMSQQESNFIRDFVNRYEDQKLIVWVVAEEYSSTLTPSRVAQIAAKIKAEDANSHPVIVPQDSGNTLRDNAAIDRFDLYLNETTTAGLRASTLNAWNEANERYGLNVFDDYPSRNDFWAVAMSGSYITGMGSGWDISSSYVLSMYDCGDVVNFFENNATTFTSMKPNDALKSADTDYVLENSAEGQYVLYGKNVTSAVGLKNMPAGKYDFVWQELPASGGSYNLKTNVPIFGGDQSWQKPSGYGQELAVYISRVGSVTGTVTPTNTPSTTFTPTLTLTPTLTPVNTSTLTPTLAVTPTSCSEDLSGDGLIDLTDYSQMLANYGSSSPANPRADVDKDGIVDLTDYSRMMAKYGMVCN